MGELAGGHIVLVGMMGSGKSTVGRALAQRLGRPFCDSDELVEAATGQTVREIFEQRGEAAFRREETAALRQALASPTPTVIAAAGGVVLSADNRRVLSEAGVVVWLRAAPSVLAGRIQPSLAGGGHRPLLEKDPAATLLQLDAERRPLYQEVATITVDVDTMPVPEVVDVIVGALTS